LDFSKLLAKLNLLARNSGVEIVTFKPLKDDGKGSAPGASEGTTQAVFYQTVTLDLKLHGGFAQTLMFFDQISRLKRILNVDSVNMVPQSAEGQRGLAANLTPIETNVVLKTYRFSE
jgi:Tfp pilus assembly protein PilO